MVRSDGLLGHNLRRLDRAGTKAVQAGKALGAHPGIRSSPDLRRILSVHAVPAIALRTVISDGGKYRPRGRFVRTSNGTLFHGRDLLDMFATRIAAMFGEIERLEAEQFLSIAPDALLADLSSRYQIESAALNCDEWNREDVEGFNRQLPGEARAAIRARRARLQAR